MRRRRGGVTIAATGAVFTWSLIVYGRFEIGSKAMQLLESHPWVPTVGIAYKVGIDGLSPPLIVLTSLLCFLAAIYTWRLDRQVKAFCFLLLLLQAGMVGVFLALDAVLFYVFWELVLVPMFFMIGIWGGDNRGYASVKFFLYTLVGSVVMLLGLLLLYFALFLGFAVKVPIFPLHTWLPDAHTEALAVGSVLLAGVLLKMSGYGLLRFSLPMVPDAFRALSPWLAVLGAIGIVYGAAVALTQRDLKRMVAYSSVSHTGFVVIGIEAANASGIDGAAIQMFNDGIITGLLFFLVGMIYERYHTRDCEGSSRRFPPLASSGSSRPSHRSVCRVWPASWASSRRSWVGCRRSPSPPRSPSSVSC